MYLLQIDSFFCHYINQTYKCNYSSNTNTYKQFVNFMNISIFDLKFVKKYSIVFSIESEYKAGVSVLPSTLISNQELGGKAMLEILAFLVIGLMISITLNLALLCIIYIQWVNSHIK